jgi:tetratricopeptide (TPR) repeat protein
MLDYYYNNNSEEEPEESYPDFFYKWNDAIISGEKPGFYEPDELTEIIEIYILNDEIEKAQQAIDFALKIHGNEEELLYEILLLLNDYELWNDLLTLCEQFKDEADVWGDGHKLTALLHLGMEDEAFLFFRKLKTKYVSDTEGLIIIYQAMGESLIEMGLFDSCIEVIQEAIELLGEEIDFLWLQLLSYVSTDEIEMVIEIAEKIQQKAPLDAETWHRLGTAFQEIDDIERAIEAFEYAQSLGYEYSQRNLMNMIYAYEKNNNYGKALEKAKEYLNLYPDSYLVNILASKLCAQVENWNEALKHIDDAIKMAPVMEALYVYKSNFFLNIGEYLKAKMALIEGINKSGDPDGDLKRELSKLSSKYPEL